MSNLLDIKAGVVATNNGEGSHVSKIGERGSGYVILEERIPRMQSRRGVLATKHLQRKKRKFRASPDSEGK